MRLWGAAWLIHRLPPPSFCRGLDRRRHRRHEAQLLSDARSQIARSYAEAQKRQQLEKRAAKLRDFEAWKQDAYGRKIESRRQERDERVDGARERIKASRADAFGYISSGGYLDGFGKSAR